MRHYLARLGHGPRFFGRVFATGYHEASVRMVLEGEVDASAIDSTVLEGLYDRDPSLPSRLRVLETLGPNTAPPWVVSGTVPLTVRSAIRRTLLGMHRVPRGKAILARGRMARFAAVTDRDYDGLRRMAQVAASVEL